MYLDSEKSLFMSVSITDKLKKVVVPILFKEKEKEYIQLGSGFVISAMGGHAVVITAAHVLDEAIKKSSDKRKIKNVAPFIFDTSVQKAENNDNDICVFFNSSTMGSGAIGTVSMAWGDKYSDLAVLMANIPADYGFKVDTKVTINSKGPSVNTDVIAVGYFGLKDSTNKMAPPGLGSFLRNLFGFTAITGKFSKPIKGKVVELFNNGGIFTKTPCFRVDIPFHSGMSGGAIIDVSGEYPVVCGVISHDSSDKNSAQYGTGEFAIASAIWPALLLELTVNGNYYLKYSYQTESGKSDPKTIKRLLDFIDEGIIQDVSDPINRLVNVKRKSNGSLSFQWI